MAIIINGQTVNLDRLPAKEGREGFQVTVTEGLSAPLRLGWIQYKPLNPEESSWFWYPHPNLPDVPEADKVWHGPHKTKAEAAARLYGYVFRKPQAQANVSSLALCPACDQTVREITTEQGRLVLCEPDTTAVVCPDGITVHGYRPHATLCVPRTSSPKRGE